TASSALEAQRQGQSSYYMAIMFIQMFNLFACKCRFRLPFGKYLLKNNFTWISLASGAAFAGIIVYVPPFNTFFNTSFHLSPLYWLPPMAFGIFLVVYSAIRRIVLRILRPVQWNPEIAGLQMHPTRWSTGR
ncbi:hypothetical protein HK102_012773, partial [Quaeritorhiza haematococci]